MSSLVAVTAISLCHVAEPWLQGGGAGLADLRFPRSNRQSGVALWLHLRSLVGSACTLDCAVTDVGHAAPFTGVIRGLDFVIIPLSAVGSE